MKANVQNIRLEMVTLDGESIIRYTERLDYKVRLIRSFPLPHYQILVGLDEESGGFEEGFKVVFFQEIKTKVMETSLRR
jgi:hypothetical protein